MKAYARYRGSDIPWMKRIPAQWLTVPLMAVLVESRATNEGMAEKNLLSLSFGRIVPKDIAAVGGLLPESFGTYQIVEPDHLVFRLTDLQNDQRSLRSARVTERGIITSAYVSVRPTGIEARYADYLMRSYDTAKVFYGLGGGVRQSLKFSDVARLPVLLPTTAEQSGIADYLDSETGRIDTLIEEQQHLIAMLRERRDGVVSKAFLDSTAAESKLKHAVDDVTVGIVVQPSRWYVDEGVPALRGLNVKRGSLALKDLVYISEEGHEAHPKSQLHFRDVVVVRTGQAGAAAKIPNELDGINAIDILIVRPGDETDPDFLVWYLNSPLAASRIAFGSVGAIQGHFNVGALRELPLPVLPLGEQQRIAKHLESQVSRIDRMIEETERFIELSKERRSALITAAVTGQIDVQGVA